MIKECSDFFFVGCVGAAVVAESEVVVDLGRLDPALAGESLPFVSVDHERNPKVHFVGVVHLRVLVYSTFSREMSKIIDEFYVLLVDHFLHHVLYWFGLSKTKGFVEILDIYFMMQSKNDK
jgi:hypothetical protein